MYVEIFDKFIVKQNFEIMEIPYHDLEILIKEVVELSFEKILREYGLIDKMENPKELIYVPLKIICDELKVSKIL